MRTPSTRKVRPKSITIQPSGRFPSRGTGIRSGAPVGFSDRRRGFGVRLRAPRAGAGRKSPRPEFEPSRRLERTRPCFHGLDHLPGQAPGSDVFRTGEGTRSNFSGRDRLTLAPRQTFRFWPPSPKEASAFPNRLLGRPGERASARPFRRPVSRPLQGSGNHAGHFPQRPGASCPPPASLSPGKRRRPLPQP